jgi:hypothetical protein
MRKHKKYFLRAILSLIFLVLADISFAAIEKTKSTSNLSPKTVARISNKIFQNECGGKISALTSWNSGEGFASLGVGHNIWFPVGKKYIFKESFPVLIQYMRERDVTMPKWLDKENVPACPWGSREEFLSAIKNNDQRMWELKDFLVKTIPIQTQYLIYRLEVVLPQILQLVPDNERPNIQKSIDQLMQTQAGMYALVDYINFKGDGMSIDERYDGNGWGLLQVLRKMQQAPKKLTSNQAFAWTAGEILKQRVVSAPKDRKTREEKWLFGWLKRINTYRTWRE